MSDHKKSPVNATINDRRTPTTKPESSGSKDGRPVVRSIDTGFACTKFTTGSSDVGFGCDLYRSITPRRVASFQPDDETMKSDNKMIVTVNGMEYVIGKAAHTAMPATFTQTLDEQYALSDGYVALTYGALAQMRVSALDLVMLGLPMVNWRKLKNGLRERYIGKHRVPNLDFAGTEVTREVLIKDVRVMPQPLGGFYNYCYNNPNTERLREGRTLVVDAGGGTLDYLFLDGEVPVDARSGGVFGSVGKIVRAVAEAHQQGLSQYFNILQRIDESLRTGSPANIKGNPVEVSAKYGSVIKTVVDESMTALRADVQSLVDVDYILLTGGGAHFFQKALSELAGREVLMDKDSVFSNVRGFQYAGEAYMQHYAK